MICRSSQNYADWFMRAAQYEGRARECFVGVGLANRLFHAINPDHLEHEQFLRHRSFWEKTSENWQNKHHQVGKTCETAMTSIFGRAQMEGDRKRRRVIFRI